MTSWMKSGNVAVITGGASGIGLAAAKAFAAQGMHIAIIDRDQEALEEAQTQIDPDRENFLALNM